MTRIENIILRLVKLELPIQVPQDSSASLPEPSIPRELKLTMPCAQHQRWDIWNYSLYQQPNLFKYGGYRAHS